MGTHLLNIYLFKALDAYPYELAKAVEALNYALAYEPDNTNALCLLAEIYNTDLGNYEEAKACYEKAIASDMSNTKIYPEFIRLLINCEDFDEAQKLIDFAMTIKGIDKANIQLKQGYLFEALEKYDDAESAMKNAKTYSLNNDFDSYVDETISRVIKKRKAHNNKNRLKETNEKKEIETSKGGWFKNRLNNLL